MLDFLKGNPYPIPNKGEVRNALMDVQYTDDMWYLSRFRYQWLFVWDRFMSIHDGKIEGAKFCISYTSNNYQMFKKDLGEQSYPIILRSRLKDVKPPWALPTPGFAHKIKGELWLIEPNYFYFLDKFYENGHTYLRKRISVTVPQHQKVYDLEAHSFRYTPILGSLQAWIYVGNPKVWRDLVKEFPSCELYIPNNQLLKPYYFFSKRMGTSAVPPKTEYYVEKIFEIKKVA